MPVRTDGKKKKDGAGREKFPLSIQRILIEKGNLDFADLSLEGERFWNGSDGSEFFSSGLARFHNDYNAEYGSWSGWSYSNTSDVSTPGYLNQFSAITGSGFGPGEGNGIYAV